MQCGVFGGQRQRLLEMLDGLVVPPQPVEGDREVAEDEGVPGVGRGQLLELGQGRVELLGLERLPRRGFFQANRLAESRRCRHTNDCRQHARLRQGSHHVRSPPSAASTSSCSARTSIPQLGDLAPMQSGRLELILQRCLGPGKPGLADLIHGFSNIAASLQDVLSIEAGSP